MLLSAVPAIGLAGQLTDSALASNSVAPNIGLIASTPHQDTTGGPIVLDFTNNGSNPVTVGVAVYQDQQGPPNVPLSTEVLLAAQYYTISAHSSLTVKVGDMCTIQVDSFIKSATFNGNTAGSNVVTQFSPFDTNPATNAGPPVDAGYNTFDYQPTSANSTPPAGILGTLLSFAQTTDVCPPGNCHSECYWQSNPCDWNLPTFTVGKTSVSGLTIGDDFYTQKQLLDILGTNCSFGNAALTLAQEDIYAKLNLINHYQYTSTTAFNNILTAIQQADTALAADLTGTLGSCGGYVWACSSQGKVLLSLAKTLDPYNNCSCGCNCGGSCGSNWGGCGSNWGGCGSNWGCGNNDEISWCDSSRSCSNSWGSWNCGVSNWGCDGDDHGDNDNNCNNWGGWSNWSNWCNN